MKNIKLILLLVLCALMLLFSAPITGFASVQLKFSPDKETVRHITLENDSVQYKLLLDNGIFVTNIVDKTTGTDLMHGNSPLMFTAVKNPLWLDNVGFHLFTIEEKQTKNSKSVSITQQCSYVENPIILTQTFTLDNSPRLSWKVQIHNTATGGRAYRDPLTIRSDITFPVMQKIGFGESADTHYLIPTQRNFFCIDDASDFIFYFTRSYDPKMPIDIYNTEKDMGIYFQIISSKVDFDFTNKDDFKSKVFRLTQESGDKSVLLDCIISPHQGDWHAAFRAFKKYIRSNFDFTFYKRPVQEKYRQRLVSHFTYLYGLDIYDPETNTFRINEFLDEGEMNFGGYDYMLLWHDYQRMGIDNRNQFDMYEDLPGGLPGVKEMVDKAHARDVQVFIPYKPWDIMNGPAVQYIRPKMDREIVKVEDRVIKKGTDNHFEREAKIAKAIGSDGVFLDTMDKSDNAFREALDAVNPDNVFVSEGRPDLAAAQLVTGSWNQQGNATNRMPNVDLFRFVIPEHNVHNINRGARKRDELIHNALFNGTGFIVWEDIFGEINRYTWNERILISRYSRIIHENRDAYLTDNPIPLVKDFRDDVYVNAFPVENKCVYPVYQLGRENVNRALSDRLIGPFMPVSHPDNWHFVDVWNHQNIPTKQRDGKTCLVFPEEPTDVMSCVVGMPVNLRVEKKGETLTVSAANPPEGASLQINTVNNLTLMEEEGLTIKAATGTVNLSQLDLDFPHKVIVKLMQGDIMKDEVIIDTGWKKF